MVFSRMPDLADELAFALELADLADAITRAHFRPGGFPFENKYDGTPVTAIDRAVEAAPPVKAKTRAKAKVGAAGARTRPQRSSQLRRLRRTRGAEA